MNNLTLIIVALIAAIPPTLVGILNFLKVKENSKAIQEVHLSINSRMDQLLSSSKAESKAEGKEIGRLERKTE